MKKLFIISFLMFICNDLCCQLSVDGIAGYVGISNATYYLEKNRPDFANYEKKNSLISQVKLFSNLSKKLTLGSGIVYYQRKYNLYYNEAAYQGIYHIQNNQYLNWNFDIDYQILKKEGVSFSIVGGFLFGTRIKQKDLFYNHFTDTWQNNIDITNRTPIPRNFMSYMLLGIEGTFYYMKNYYFKLKFDVFRQIKGDYKLDSGATDKVYYSYGGDIFILNFQLGLFYKISHK